MSDGSDLLISFGIGGNAEEFPHFGWANPEEGHTWTIGVESGLALPRPRIAGAYQLVVEVAPFIDEDKVPVQRLTVVVNGGEVGNFPIREPVSIKCLVPRSLIEAGREWVSIVFRHPDAAKPTEVSESPDFRQIALSFKTVCFSHQAEVDNADTESAENAGASLVSGSAAELLQAFENLGESDEFGLVQRHFGAERPGLLRFARAPLPVLLRGLQTRFEGLGDPERIEVLANNRQEYLVFDRCFGFVYRPGLRVGDAAPEAIRRDQAAQLAFLRRRLIVDLTEARKIFVYRGPRHVPERLIRHLISALCAYGPNTLLWVDLHDAKHPPGTLEAPSDRIFKGYLDRYAIGADGQPPSVDCWLTLCDDTYGRYLARPSAMPAEPRPMAAESGRL